jgi:membrane protein YdbS with pleckstrin-like domain
VTTIEQAQGAPVRLRPPRNRVERRAIRYWLASEAIGTAVVAVVLGALALIISPARMWLLLALGVAMLLLIPYTLVVPFWRYRVHRWEVTDEAVYTRSGWLWEEWRVAPLSRVQTVDTQRGPLEQAFRLATVTVTTASSAGALKIAGLDHQVAEDLVEHLTRVAQANQGDAT